MKYHFKVHNDNGELWAECIELKGCVTQAETTEELEFNMKESLNLYLDEPENSKLDFPLPKDLKRKKDIVLVTVDPAIAFAILLKKARAEKGITQSGMAKLLNYKSIFSYQKLESAKSANPTLTKIQKLKNILPNLRLDLLFS